MANRKISAATSNSIPALTDRVPTARRNSTQALATTFEKMAEFFHGLAFENVLWHGAVGDGATDDSTAFQTAADRLAAAGGGILFVPGGLSYYLGSQITLNSSGLCVRAHGATIVPGYADGAQFVWGNGDTRIQDVEWSGGVFDPGSDGPEQSVFETRYVRTLHMDSIRGANIWQFMRLGRYSDGTTKNHYQWWARNIDVNMRSPDHSHAVEVRNFSGNLQFTGVFFEGVVAAIDASGPDALHCHENAVVRVDEVRITGGNLKQFRRAISSDGGRIVNISTDASSRFDNSGDWALYFRAQTALESDGAGNVNLAGFFALGGEGGGVYLENQVSGGSMDSIRLHDLFFVRLGNSAIKIVATGTGTIYGPIAISGIAGSTDEMPDATTDFISVDAAATQQIRGVSIANINMSGNSAATNKPRHVVYLDTANAAVSVDQDTIVGSSYTGSAFHNVTPIAGQVYYQQFKLMLRNSGGTLQHAIMSGLTESTASDYADKINGASATWTATPTGANGSTAFATGVKRDSSQVSRLILDTAAQDLESVKVGGVSLDFNSSGIALAPRVTWTNVDVNGVTRVRPTIELRNATTGALVDFDTTNWALNEVTYISLELWIA